MWITCNVRLCEQTEYCHTFAKLFPNIPSEKTAVRVYFTVPSIQTDLSSIPHQPQCLWQSLARLGPRTALRCVLATLMRNIKTINWRCITAYGIQVKILVNKLCLPISCTRPKWQQLSKAYYTVKDRLSDEDKLLFWDSVIIFAYQFIIRNATYCNGLV